MERRSHFSMQVLQKRCMHCAISRASLMTPASTQRQSRCLSIHDTSWGPLPSQRCRVGIRKRQVKAAPRHTAHRVSSSNASKSSSSLLQPQAGPAVRGQPECQRSRI